MESAEVTAALQSSRYNETVVVNVSADQQQQDDSGTCSQQQQPRELLLIPCLDEVNGGVLWNDLASAEQVARQQQEATNSDIDGDLDFDDIGIIRHLRTKRWFFPMLNDTRRNELYEAAIQAACYRVVRQFWDDRASNNKSNSSRNEDSNSAVIRILDIGSGTGLLAMLAAKYVQQALDDYCDDEHKHEASASASIDDKAKAQQPLVRVTSLEMSAAMSRLARLTVADNGLQDTISILEHHSTDQSTLTTTNTNIGDGPEQPQVYNSNQYYDLCVSELLESSLLGEGMLPALRDAWDRHLHPKATIVPQKARVYCQLVEGAFLANYWGPHSDSSKAISTSTSVDDEEATPTSPTAQQLRLTLSANENDLMMDGGARGGFVLHIHAEHWVEGNFNDNTCNDNDNDNNEKETTDSNELQFLVKPLSDPIQVMDFDFSRPDRIPKSEGRRLPIQVVPHRSGTCHAVLFWWELDLWKDATASDKDTPNATCSHQNPKENVGNCTYSTQVGQAPWQDHWHQNLFVFTNSKTTNSANDGGTGDTQEDDTTAVAFGYKVQAEEPCHLIASHEDTRIWFSMMTSTGIPNNNNNNNNSTAKDPPTKRRKQDYSIDSKTEAEHQVIPEAETVARKVLISPSRAWQLNDKARIKLFQRGIRAALANKGKDAVVLDLSDFSLCAILAALEGASRVSSVESSSGVIPNLSARVAQLSNGLPRTNENGDASEASKSNVFQVLQCHAEQITLELLNGEHGSKVESPDPVEVVMAEPYYDMLEGWHLQEALNYFYLVRALRRRGILSETAISVPSVGIIRGCAIQSFPLKHAYGRCGKVHDGKGDQDSCKAPICGFDHGRANRYGDRFHEHDLSLPMWEYDLVELTESFDIAQLRYSSEQEIAPRAWKVCVPFQQGGACHGMLVWIDYGISTTLISSDERDGAKGETMEFLRTRGRPYQQLVRMLSTPVAVAADDFDRYEFICKFQCGGQALWESHNFDIQVIKKER